MMPWKPCGYWSWNSWLLFLFLWSQAITIPTSHHMVYVIVAMGTLFIILGLILTEKNAHILLSGYNTLSKGEQSKTDIGPLVRYFRRFHQLFGLLFIAMGLGIRAFWGEHYATFFLVLFPILAYLFFFLRTLRFVEGPMLAQHKLGIYILLFTLFVLVLTYLIIQKSTP